MSTISILTVSYNTKDILQQCLCSVFASQLAPGDNLEVVIVDNASVDGSADMVAQAFPKVNLVRNQENVGFAKANNQALAKSHGDYIFVLNPDTIVGPSVIADLKSVLTAESQNQFHSKGLPIGALAPKLINADGTPQPSCYHLPTLTNAFAEFFLGQAGRYLKYLPPQHEPTIVEAGVGAALFLPKTTIAVIGGLFDEKFFFYYEDLDLCRRLQASGLALLYVPAIVVTHLHGESVKKRGSWGYEQNQKSAKIYFGPIRYYLITLILKYGQKWQKFLDLVRIRKGA